jgi:hypothetical protein
VARSPWTPPPATVAFPVVPQGGEESSRVGGSTVQGTCQGGQPPRSGTKYFLPHASFQDKQRWYCAVFYKMENILLNPWRLACRITAAGISGILCTDNCESDDSTGCFLWAPPICCPGWEVPCENCQDRTITTQGQKTYFRRPVNLRGKETCILQSINAFAKWPSSISCLSSWSPLKLLKSNAKLWAYF